jgi:lipoprotein-releasing system permease protein
VKQAKAGPGPYGSAAGPFSRWERAIAGRYLRARRKEAGVALISIIAFLGILFAVAVLIIVMSVMNGFRTELLGRILGFNGHLYVAGPVLSASNRDQAVANIRAVPGVIQAIPMVEAQAMAIGRGQIAGAIVRGVTPEDLAATKIVSGNIRRGSLEGFGEGEEGGDLVLIGSRLADSLGVEAGDSISLISPSGAATAFGSSPTQKDYTVGGVFEVGMSDYDQTFIYMPLKQAQLFFGRDAAVDVIEIKVSDPDDAPALKPAVQRAAGPGGMVNDWTEKNQAFFTALQVERNTMRLILMLLVIIAALNIVSGLIMLVKNKGRDIAILRTMGASRGAVLRIFLMAGGAIGVAGSACGLAVGALFCLNIEKIQQFVEWVTGTPVFNAKVYFLSHIPARVDWSEVGLIVGLSVLISLAASLLPAFWASRLDPVEALRYE